MILQKNVLSINKICGWIIIVFVCLYTYAYSQQKVGSLKGKVIDVRTQQPLENVIIKFINTKIFGVSDIRGNFIILNIPMGNYNIGFSRHGYQTLIFPNKKISHGINTSVIAELSTWIDGVDDVFFIGGIEISAQKELLPEKIETVTQINSNNIEHIQATSLGDVLDLVPGVEMKNQPSLKVPVKAKIRDPRNENLLTAFGTKIIIDDIPFSNNANLQGPLLDAVYTGTGNGIDLREIPADNIESVEVIRGIASAEYGDYVGGIIDVNTKASDQSIHRIKGKNNPDTKEINFGGNFSLAETRINYNFNWAYSERDVRKDYDNTQRLAAQLNFQNTIFDDRLFIQNQFKYYTLFENINQNPNDPDALESRNKGYRFIYGNKFTYKINPLSKLYSSISINYRRVDSYEQTMTTAENRVISTLMNEGTMIGIKLYGSYLYRQRTIGDEVGIGQKIA